MVVPVFQLLPIEGSPASCPRYSTVFADGPWLLEITLTRVGGASKLWNPTFGPGSCGAGGRAGVGVGVGGADVTWITTCAPFVLVRPAESVTVNRAV